MKWFIAMLAIAGFFVWYVLWGRTWLRPKPWMQWLYTSKVGEWIEINVFKKSETILFARFKIVIGMLLTVLTQTQAIDITPLMPLVPSGWEGIVTFGWNLIPLTITALGWVDEQLRYKTTLPIDVVSLPEDEKQKPEVAAAVAKLDEAKVEAVAVAKEATADGAV